jgi:hypothetical protein
MNNRERREPRRLTRTEREAREAFRADEAKKALTGYEKRSRNFLNRERLKAERLAREAEAIRQASALVR